MLYGPSGVGKTFLALDWSYSIAAGLPWSRCDARAGWVLYIAAEGSGRLTARTRAWQQARRHSEPERVRFVVQAINFLQRAEVERARRTVAAMPEPPVLIVVDTLARCMVGGDENSARDVGLFVDGVDRVRADADAAALIVHHTGRSGEHERGSTALRGAADAMHSFQPDGADALLACAKAKDAEPYAPFRLHLQAVAESCVLAVGHDPGRLAPAETKVLEAVSGSFGTEPASATTIGDVSGLPKSSLYRTLKSLDERGFLAVEANGKRKRWSLTDAGQSQLVPSSPKTPAETSPTTPPTLGGGTRDWNETERPATEQEEALLARHRDLELGEA